ncbi:MAG: ABC transporter permease [Silvanigrellaceae bacterium]
MFWKQVSFAVRNLGRNKRRNAATASAIVLGYAGLVLLSGFVTRIEKFFRATSVYFNQTGTLSVYKPGGVEKHLLFPKKYSISETEQQDIRRIATELFPQAEAVGATLEGFTLIGNGCKTWPVKIRGIEPELEKRLTNHASVREFAPELIAARKGSGLWQHPGIVPVVVTEKVARNLGKSKIRQPQSELESSGNTSTFDCSAINIEELVDNDTNIQLAARTFSNDFSAIDADIVGHYSSGLELLEESTALIPLKDLQRLYETEGVTNMVIFLPWDAIPELAAEKLSKALANAGLELEVHHYRELSVNPFYAGFMNLIYVMSVFFLALSIGVVTLTVSDAMTMSVIERSREIGTLRALGFKQKQITQTFALEGQILAILCLPMGFLIAFTTSILVNAGKFYFEVPGVSTQVQLNLAIDPLHCLWLGLMLMSLCSLSGWLTSIRTSRKEIVRLLSSHSS